MSATADRTDPPAAGQAPPIPVTLRAVAAWLESHEEVEPFEINFFGARYRGGPVEVNVFALDADRMAAIVRAVGGRWEKDGDEDRFELRQQIAPGAVVRLISDRESVCERVVTGTTTVTEPDPNAPMVEREVETYEWRCGSLLAAAGVED